MTRRFAARLVLALALASAMVGSAAAQQYDRFFVVGLVKMPGSYALSGTVTIREGVTLAGGLAEGATLEGLQVIRIVDGKTVTLDAAPDDVIQPNDTIRVSRRPAQHQR